MDSSQPLSASAIPLVQSISVSASASVLLLALPTNVGQNLPNLIVTPLLQPSSIVVVHLASMDTIVPFSHTHQVISLKLTNTNYLYL
jgi:hypothetical protein